METVVTRGQQYPKLYAEAPGSIVIMPPVNRTNAVEAKEYFYTTLYRPLCEKGYYVFSPYLTMELMLTTSLTDQVVAGRRCTDAVLSDMPLGKYSPAYGTDREVKAGKSYFEATVKSCPSTERLTRVTQPSVEGRVTRVCSQRQEAVVRRCLIAVPVSRCSWQAW